MLITSWSNILRLSTSLCVVPAACGIEDELIIGERLRLYSIGLWGVSPSEHDDIAGDPGMQPVPALLHTELSSRWASGDASEKFNFLQYKKKNTNDIIGNQSANHFITKFNNKHHITCLRCYGRSFHAPCRPADSVEWAWQPRNFWGPSRDQWQI